MGATGLRLGIMNRWEAAKAHPDAMISIVDPGEAPPATAPRHLVLEMHDLDSPEPTRPDLVVPDRDHARRIVAFAREVAELARRQPTTLVVHCSAGLSRSPAAAIGVLGACHPERGPGWADHRVQQLTGHLAEPNVALRAHLHAELGWQAASGRTQPEPDRARRHSKETGLDR